MVILSISSVILDKDKGNKKGYIFEKKELETRNSFIYSCAWPNVHYTYKYIYNRLYQFVKWLCSLKLPWSMWHHIENYTLNDRGEDRIHAVSAAKYQKYVLILILKHATVLAEVIKLHDVHLFKIMPYQKCNVLKSTCKKWPYWKLVTSERFKIPL